MKSLKRIALVLLLLLGAFVYYTLSSTGFFREVKPMIQGKILQQIAVKGAEDMMVSPQDSFVLISSTDRTNRSAPKKEGGLYVIDLTSKPYTPQLLTGSLDFDFEPHGISYYKKDSVYHIMAINHAHGIHSIEVFRMDRKAMTHQRTIKDASMIRPNDLVMIDEDRFYFTNDHGYTEGIGKFMEEYLGLAVSNVVYYDGKNFKEVAKGIAYANGINFDQKRNLMYLSSPRSFSVKVYDRLADGSLSFIEDIDCGTGVDNIEFDADQNLWIGCHPSLLRFAAYAKGDKETSPSEVIKIKYKNKGDYSVEKIFIDDGSKMSGASVAAPMGKLVFVGNVMDNHILVLEQGE